MHMEICFDVSNDVVRSYRFTNAVQRICLRFVSNWLNRFKCVRCIIVFIKFRCTFNVKIVVMRKNIKFLKNPINSNGLIRFYMTFTNYSMF